MVHLQIHLADQFINNILLKRHYITVYIPFPIIHLQWAVGGGKVLMTTPEFNLLRYGVTIVYNGYFYEFVSS